VLEYLLDVGLPAGSRALFIELPEVLQRLPEVLDLSRLPKTLALRSTEDWPEALEELDLDSYIFLDNLNLLESIGATDGHLPEYKEAYWHLKQQLELRNWQVKADLGSESFIIRQLENIPDNRDPAYCLKESFNGKTGVVLGGGPSLDKILPWLLEHQEQVVIIAVSRIARRLLEVGLTPHLVFTTDPQDVSYEVSKDMLRFDSKMVLVSAYHACPQLVGQWRGRGLYLGSRLPWPSSLNVENYNLSGPTVTNSALATARNMGFSQILLAGFDLCFTKDGFSHAQGSRERDAGPRIEELFPTVENYAGEIVPTTQAYFAAMTDLEAQAKTAAQDGCQILNIAEEAARIEGVAYCPLEKVLISPCEENPGIIIHRILPDDDISQHRKYTAAMLQELRVTETTLVKMQNLSRKALECNEGLFGRKGKKADYKYKLRMDKIEKRLNDEFSDLVYLVKKFGIRWFLKTTRPDSDVEWTDDEIEEVGRLYYEAYLSSCRDLVRMVKAAQKKLELRQKELEAVPDLECLEAFWKQESQLGRAQLMLDAMSVAYSPETIDRLKGLAGHFWEQVASRKALIREGCFHAVDVKSKALLYFRKGDLTELETLRKSIVDHFSDIERARQLQILIEGLIAELNEQPDIALQAYHELVGVEMGALTEEALKRVATLSLKVQDSDNALLALECLAHISPAHQLNYASMLRLVGRLQDAAGVYGDYLTKMPDDATAMLTLGQLYMEMKALDAARTAFGYVLEVDPENSAAQTLLEQLGGANAQQ
jgi:tetratricopeptide (TPR) repeat protein